MTAEVHFYLLNRASPPESEMLWMDGLTGYLITDHPPVVGDTITVSGRRTDPDDAERLLPVCGVFRVVGRHLQPPGYGSTVWPRGHVRSGHPEWIDVVLEPTTGLFDPASWRQE